MFNKLFDERQKTDYGNLVSYYRDNAFRLTTQGY